MGHHALKTSTYLQLGHATAPFTHHAAQTTFFQLAAGPHRCVLAQDRSGAHSLCEHRPPPRASTTVYKQHHQAPEPGSRLSKRALLSSLSLPLPASRKPRPFCFRRGASSMSDIWPPQSSGAPLLGDRCQCKGAAQATGDSVVNEGLIYVTCCVVVAGGVSTAAAAVHVACRPEHVWCCNV
jgi:hypothetical protein